jgi:alpha-galactosidase
MLSDRFRLCQFRPAILLVLSLIAPNPAAADATPVTVGSDDTQVTIQLINGREAITSFLCKSSGFDWVGPPANAMPMPLIDSVEVAGRQRALVWHQKTEAASKPQANEHTLAFVCDDPAVEIRSSWTARPGPGPVEHRLVIVNRAAEPLLLPLQASLSMNMHVPAGHAIEQWWVDKGAGTPTVDGTHHRPIAAGSESLLRCWPSGRDNPRDPIPWTCVQDMEGGQGWYAGVEFTARVQIALKQERPGAGQSSEPLHLMIGLQPDPKMQYFTRVLPGESFEAPPIFIGCYQGQVDDGANRLRRWVRRNLTPAVRVKPYPLLVNNSWGSGMAVDEALSRKMIDESADLGLEMFHIDAGWFRTVGDWRPDPRKFPNGLGPIADYAHQRGLKFGLWVGWTQGGDQTDGSGEHAILSPHDPLMAHWFHQDFDKSWKAGEFTGATVCLAEPRAVDWCLNSLRTIVRDAKLDMLEHDQTMVLDGCQQDSHLHTASRVDAGYRSALGYYRVYDTIRAENPKLLFENCVNGGHMVDYGAVRRCHYISITDTYDPLSNRRAFYDASYALPPAMCECYVANVAVHGLPQFKFMLRSGMMGWCTIMTDTNKWTAAQHDAARHEFSQYKQRLRPLIREANLYHVSERPDGIHWDGMEYFNPANGAGALFAFRGTGGEPEHSFVLKGLEPDAKYAISFEDEAGPPTTRPGRELMAAGISLKLPEPESSEIVYLQRQ